MERSFSFIGLIFVTYLIHSVHSLPGKPEDEFDRKYVGVVFSPYVKNKIVDDDPRWKNYTMADVKSMLKLVSTKFEQISTYGMGADVAGESWEVGNAVGLTPMAAAQVNAENGALSIKATIGMWHNEVPALTRQEAINAISASKQANSIYPNTVHGIALSSFTWMGYRNWQQTIEFVQEYRVLAKEINVKIGMRLDICDQIIPEARPEEPTKEQGPSNTSSTAVLSDIKKIASVTDFLICTRFPPATMVSSGTEFTAIEMSKQMVKYEKALVAVNRKLEVYWETGWPSDGISWFGSVNTARNLRDFWKYFGVQAKENKLTMYMFGAFDEPWKIRQDKDATHPQGPNGAESHFGWWTLGSIEEIENITQEHIKEKIPEKIKEVSEGLSAGTVAVIILMVLVPIIGLLVWKLHKAGETIERLSEQDIKEFRDGIPDGKANSGNSSDYALRVAYDISYELDKDGFVIDEKDILGSGAFGTVFKGTINGIDDFVAFKRPNRDIGASQLRNVLQEIKIMIFLGKHDNIVAILGANTDRMKDGIIYIASEWCALGSLESYMRDIPRTFTAPGYENLFHQAPVPVEQSQGQDVRYVNAPGRQVQKTTEIPISSLIRWSFEIASGMEYLASKRVIHADLASRNVLLTAGGTAKITDFGLSRRLYEYTQYVKSNQEPLPWRWMSIESLNRLAFSSQSDVWSYAVTLWEIFTLGDVPYPGLSWNIDFVDKLEEGLRLKRPKFATAEIYEEMLKCWNGDPESRPTFTELKTYFQTLTFEEGKLGNLLSV